jgi:mono/diheme cytochrome c family protein
MWRCSLALLALLLVGCEQYPSGGDYRIRRDMVDQPSFRPQRDPRLPAAGSVPVKADEPPSAADSLAQGEKLFRITCVPCHGTAGTGNGLVAAKMAAKPANLTAEKYLIVTDDHISEVIRAGFGVMPPYAESLAPAERRYVIEYVRKLQKR